MDEFLVDAVPMLEPTVLDATSNDSDTNWCQASTEIGSTGDYGTPGADNVHCVPYPFATVCDGTEGTGELVPQFVGACPVLVVASLHTLLGHGLGSSFFVLITST